MRALARIVMCVRAMRAPTAAHLRRELFRLQCAWRRAHHVASMAGAPLPPFPREQIEGIAAQLPPTRTAPGEVTGAELGESREHAAATFRAEPTGRARATDLGEKECSAWVHCHHADPALSAVRCEQQTRVELSDREAPASVHLRSRLRSQFAWVEATSSETGLAAIRADAWLEISIGADVTTTAVSTPFYDHISMGRQLYFPSRKLWTTDLEAVIDVPGGAGHVLIVTEAIEILASAEEGSNAYVSGRFAWEPLRVASCVG